MEHNNDIQAALDYITGAGHGDFPPEIEDTIKRVLKSALTALPDLIRVIELAEDELNHVDKVIKELKTDKYGRFRPTKAQGEAIWFSVSQALTEIRKMKGE